MLLCKVIVKIVPYKLKLKWLDNFFVILPNIKFYENPFSSFRAVTCVQMIRRNERFS
jgi:hypothetical protein